MVKEKLKFKRVYFYALIAFIVLNICAIFFVFGNYRTKNKENSLISSTKIKYSKLKEKIEDINENLVTQNDSLSLLVIDDLQSKEIELDSLLNKNEFTSASLIFISSKIDDLNSKSDKIYSELIASKL